MHSGEEGLRPCGFSGKERQSMGACLLVLFPCKVRVVRHPLVILTLRCLGRAICLVSYSRMLEPVVLLPSFLLLIGLVAVDVIREPRVAFTFCCLMSGPSLERFACPEPASVPSSGCCKTHSWTVSMTRKKTISQTRKHTFGLQLSVCVTGEEGAIKARCPSDSVALESGNPEDGVPPLGHLRSRTLRTICDDDGGSATWCLAREVATALSYAILGSRALRSSEEESLFNHGPLCC